MPEWDDHFLSLFPHRFDYIYAPHPEPGERPVWQTENRHPLSDRLICQGAYLFGVRFGTTTRYCLIDIDSNSIYHPQRDPFALPQILQALEPLGLVSSVLCTSSYSGGLHLYFPFEQPQLSWQLASAMTVLLQSAGLKIAPGQLEIFPNARNYVVEGHPSLFNAHRLPLQAGSHLLDLDLQPIWSDSTRFVQQWMFCQSRNDVDTAAVKRVLKQFKRKRYCLSGRADKFINDLNAEIEMGWTGPGQTNRLLGRITMRCYIFHHVLTGGKPLVGQSLVKEIVKTAKALPGYREWCRHQHEIEQRAEDWARCIENSRYFPYGDVEQRSQSQSQSAAGQDSVDHPSDAEGVSAPLTWNQRQSQAARDKIRQAIAEMLETGCLAAGATARFRALLKYGIGGGSLYRHRDLWHPKCLWKTPPDPLALQEDSQLDYQEGASNWHSPPSLFPAIGGESPTGEALADSVRPVSEAGGNSEGDRIFAQLSRLGAQTDQPHDSKPGKGKPTQQPAASGLEYVQQVLLEIKTQPGAKSSHSPVDQRQDQEVRYQQLQQARREKFLASGDPILMAEAQSWRKADLATDWVSPDPGLPLPSVSTGPQDAANQLPLALETSAAEDERSPVDLSEVLAEISVHIRRLGWSPEQIQNHLEHQFGKRSQARLDDEELLVWLMWLQQAEIYDSG